MMKNIFQNQTFQRIFSLLFAICLFFFILTFSIGFPIYCRPFYYLQIDLYELPERSGFTKEEIITAYNEMLDYLTLPGKEFSVGIMKFSESGADHFVDCKVLFDLNAGVLIGSGVCLVLLTLIRIFGKMGKFTLGKRSAAFYGAVSAIVVPIVLGLAVAIDFDSAFTIFHKLFFPGKDNWVFDARTDEIIRVLPQDFFMNCAIFIGIGILTWSVTIIILEFIKKKGDGIENGK